MSRRCADGGEHAWEPRQRSAGEICRGCGDLYPCPRACTHLDCAELRGEPTTSGPFRLVVAGDLERADAGAAQAPA